MNEKDSNQNQRSFSQKVRESIMLASPRVIIIFGVGHPFELVKTRMQANPYIRSAILLAKDIYKTTGIKGFYTAGLPNFSRALLKEIYRSPLRGMLQAEYSQLFPDLSKASVSTLTSLSMALSDTLILCPLERIKVWLMTNYSKDRSVTQFFTNRSDNALPLYKDLFKGGNVSLARSTLSWTSYLVPESIIREMVEKNSRRVSNKDSMMLFPEELLSGALGGIVNGLITLPFDTIKTRVQQEGYKDTASIKKMYKIGKSLVQKHGFSKGLYPGFMTRLIHYSIVGIITADIIKKVDNIWQPNTAKR